MSDKLDRRIVWLDSIRVFAIFLVVLGHTPISGDIADGFRYFRMPFFFFCSGFLFSFEREQSFKIFMYRKIKHLIVPYFTLHFITYFFWLLLDRHYGSDVGANISVFDPLLDIILFRTSIDCIPLWFIPCIFVVEFVFFVLFRNKRLIGLKILALLIVAYVMQIWGRTDIPFMLGSASTGILFFLVAFFLKQRLIKILVDWSRLKKAGIFVLLFVFIVIGISYNGKTHIYLQSYGANYFLYLGISISCVIASILLFNLSPFAEKRNSLVEYLSKNLILIVGLHLIFGRIPKIITYYGLGLPLDIYDGSYILNILSAVLTIACLIPCIYLMNKYIPVLLGKTK